MSSNEEREYEIDRIERELKAKEEQQRLKQIESEISRQTEAQSDAKFYPTRKYQGEESSKKPAKFLTPKVVLGLKLFGLGVAALVAVRIAGAVANIVIIGALGYAIYQLFIKKKE